MEAMHPNTKVIRKGERVLLAQDVPNVLANSDIVAGNAYQWAAGLTMVPDPEGPYLALITHRGVNAPPRLETLPVGAQVRRGAGWDSDEYDYPEDCGDIGTVVRVDDDPVMPYLVQWGEGETWWHSRACLEVVSLPEVAVGAGSHPGIIIPGPSWVPERSQAPLADLQARHAERMQAVVCASFGPSRHVEDRSTPGVGRLPDMVPAAVMARRGPQPRVVPTDLDDHWFPDADESMSGRIR